MKSPRSTEKSPYNQMCEHCEGTVRSKKIDQEAFKHKRGFVILEGVTIGVCDECGMRYYSADILHTVHDIATGAKPFDRMDKIPVSHFPG